jgi:hypothetical protein
VLLIGPADVLRRGDGDEERAKGSSDFVSG